MDYTRLYNMSFASVYDLYLKKIERKERTKEELDAVLSWLTGFSDEQFQTLMTEKHTLKEFFEVAEIHPLAGLIKGKICGVQIEEIQDPLMKKIRYMDKLVDELAKGKKIEKILRTK
ncbi:DUF2200 domain-containing protein [Enterococcus italicus]|uniref:DUF2200 domain-containing protein n=1 Tax=Enterococcus italicus (strain DSM 15952 / CCUG 50447 / LMG 22039 / TP 1.5) TaxID=888064 RepID=E6LHZ4_ENTI1|nr:DUF2200 domain-containing protein [Enterococcus italicus]EFU73160.1 hypothetical protein HMPREF9088_1984 [Enterococcus italicus DSM 15952]